MSLTTKLILGSKPEPGTLLELQQKAGVPPDKSINLMVFETSFKDKKIYTCWSGGLIENGEPKLTLIGRAALEALVNLPIGNNELLVFQELKMGATPLREKVRAAVMKAAAGTKICFIGDMQGELDGHMHKAFNVSRDPINISH
jgi:hypothetical protein